MLKIYTTFTLNIKCAMIYSLSMVLVFIFINSPSDRMVPRVKDNNPHGTQKTFSLDFDEEQAREGRQENFKISKLITFN